MSLVLILSIVCLVLNIYITLMIVYLIMYIKRLYRIDKQLIKVDSKTKKVGSTTSKGQVESADTTATRRSDLSSFWTDSDMSIKTVHSDADETNLETDSKGGLNGDDNKTNSKDIGEPSEKKLIDDAVTLYRYKSTDSQDQSTDISNQSEPEQVTNNLLNSSTTSELPMITSIPKTQNVSDSEASIASPSITPMRNNVLDRSKASEPPEVTEEPEAKTSTETTSSEESFEEMRPIDDNGFSLEQI